MNTAVIEKPAKVAINGVDVPTLIATIGAVGEQPELAEFQFRAQSHWVKGTQSQTRINGFTGAGGEQSRDDDFVLDSDHPAVLCGGDQGAAPVEFLLAALASCITAGIGNIASVRQIELDSVKTEVAGDINLLGILGLSDQLRNGYTGISATFTIKGNATPEQLRQIVEKSVARSAVFDVLKNGTNVQVNAVAA